MHDSWGVSAQCAACKDRREPCASSQTPFISLSLCLSLGAWGTASCPPDAPHFIPTVRQLL